ncbi:MAG: hypothetical protein HW387_1259 [Parachlamydiales bacterium]|nr:hypothetical protein [Parachlamydiales bacterium]
MILTLIHKNPEEGIPSFQINYANYYQKEPPPSPILEKIRTAVLFVFVAIARFAIAFARASFCTARHSWTAFKGMVIGYNGGIFLLPPLSIYSAGLRVFYWLLGLCANTIHKTFEYFSESMKFNSNTLSQYELGEELDVRHFRTCNREIDVSHIPTQVQVKGLIAAFDQINFTDPTTPDYMSERFRQESASKTYTREQLRESLLQLINHVENRTPYIGTPPKHDIDGLNRFYQQLENAIRFCLHKAQSELETFLKWNPDPKNYGEDQKNRHRNFLENVAQVAITFAIAGQHCGARYMGEAMSLYFSWKGESEGLSVEEELIEMLANQRLEIAQKEANLLSSDTHDYTRYMQTIGSSLAIPGTANVVEYLSNKMDLHSLIPSFLEKYSVNAVIDTVQTKYMKSQEFREKVQEWLVEHRGDWNRQTKEILDQLTAQVIGIVQNSANKDVSIPMNDFYRLCEWIEEKRLDPNESQRVSFDEIRRICIYGQKKLSLSKPDYEELEKRMCWTFSATHLGSELTEILKAYLEQEINLPTDFESRLAIRFPVAKKIDQIKKLVPTLSFDTIERIVQGRVDAKESIAASLDIDRKSLFLEQILPPDGSLSSTVVEWLLVDHQILLPQPPSSFAAFQTTSYGDRL